MKDLTTEVRMLQLKLEFLRELCNDSYVPLADQARLLQDECEILSKSFIRSEFRRQPSSAMVQAAALSLEWRIKDDAHSLGRPMDYTDWIETHLRTDDNLRYTDESMGYLSLRCGLQSCPHYVYGFLTVDELNTHLDAHNKSVPTEQVIPVQMEHTVQDLELATLTDTVEDGTSGTDFVYVSFESGSSKKRKDQRSAASRKRQKHNNEILDDNVKCVREKDPCLRCKMLKKQCDGETPCKQCPQQEDTAHGDYWKVLGCYRRPLKDLRDVFIPEYYFRAHGIFDLPPPPSVLQSYDETFPGLWMNWLNRNITLVLRNSKEFNTFALKNKAYYSNHWRDDFLRKLTTEFPNHNKLCEIEWSPELWTLFLLQQPTKSRGHAAITDAYNLLAHPLTGLLGRLEVQAIGFAFILLERTSPENRMGTGPDTYDYSADFIHHEALQRLSDFMAIYLSVFSRRCSRRKGLSEHWISTFTGLCFYSILKSILIDLQVHDCNGDDTAQSKIAAQIDSAYKALVSAFIWSSKSDILLKKFRCTGMYGLGTHLGEEDGEEDEEGEEPAGFYQLCQVVQRDKWEERGIKSTKDFLMGLGSGFFNDGTYNGFYIQQYGLEKQENIKAKAFSQSARGRATASLTPEERRNEYTGYDAQPSFASPGTDMTSRTISSTFMINPQLSEPTAEQLSDRHRLNLQIGAENLENTIMDMNGHISARVSNASTIEMHSQSISAASLEQNSNENENENDDQLHRLEERAVWPFRRPPSFDSFMRDGDDRISQNIDRTESDSHNDALFNPSPVDSIPTAMLSASAAVQTTSVSRPQSGILSRMLQAAQAQHLKGYQGDPARQLKKPYKQGSPLAPSSNSSERTYGSAQKMRQRRKVERDSRTLQQQIQSASPEHVIPETILPSDAMINCEDFDRI